MPVFLLYPHAWQHLNSLMMLTAFVLLLLFSGRLCWDVRRLAGRVESDPTRGELFAIGSFVLLVGSGSVVLYLAAFTFPYHEAILWSIAFSVGALSYAVRLVTEPRISLALRLAAACTLAVLARVTVGVGAIATLMLIAAAFAALLANQGRYRDGLGRALGVAELARPAGLIWLLGLLVAIPPAAYMAVNYAKFGSLTEIPLRYHVSYVMYPQRLELLDPYFGLFSLRAIPMNVVEYVRPDGLTWSPRFPFFALKRRESFFNPWDSRHDLVVPNAGVLVTMPALVALAVVGAVAIVVRRRLSGRSGSAGVSDRLAALRLPLAGAFVTCFATLAWRGIIQRYQADFVPFLVVAGAAGLWMVLTWRPSWPRRLVLSGLVAAALFSACVNALLAIDYQHTGHEAAPQLRVRYAAFQDYVDAQLVRANLR